jgi:hypothetical protein
MMTSSVVVGSYHPMYGSHLARRMSISQRDDDDSVLNLQPLDPTTPSPEDLSQKPVAKKKQQQPSLSEKESKAYVKRSFEDKPPMHSSAHHSVSGDDVITCHPCDTVLTFALLVSFECVSIRDL